MSDIREQLDKIFTKLIPLDVSEENEVTYHESKPFNSQLDLAEALIQEQIRQTQVKCAAELSILDQEITSLKAQIKELKNE